jgi:hypothetical protein
VIEKHRRKYEENEGYMGKIRRCMRKSIKAFWVEFLVTLV